MNTATLDTAGTAARDGVVLLARQPIFDSSWKVHGYELLFRRQDGSGWPFRDESAATASVLVAAFAELTLGAVTSGARAWINVPRSFLLETDVPAVLPKERVVLEVLEREDVDDALLGRLRELARLGYEIALDDFEMTPQTTPLLDLATYVKLDLRALGLGGVSEHARRLSPYKRRLIAEKVETESEFRACVRMGIGLHQGFYFERPRLLTGRPTPHQALAGLAAVTGLGPEATFEDVEAILQRDPGMSMRLLKFIGSAAAGLRHRVTSLRQALALVGVSTVRQWLLLVLLSEHAGSRPEVLRSGLVRAKLCERLAGGARVKGDAAFLVGLLSIADALFDVDLAVVVEPLPLADDLRDALIRRGGRLGMLLEQAVAIERGGPSPDPRALFDAVRWADAQLNELAGSLAASA